jgi:hypothetical protein
VETTKLQKKDLSMQMDTVAGTKMQKLEFGITTLTRKSSSSKELS